MAPLCPVGMSWGADLRSRPYLTRLGCLSARQTDLLYHSAQLGCSGLVWDAGCETLLSSLYESKAAEPYSPCLIDPHARSGARDPNPGGARGGGARCSLLPGLGTLFKDNVIKDNTGCSSRGVPHYPEKSLSAGLIGRASELSIAARGRSGKQQMWQSQR